MHTFAVGIVGASGYSGLELSRLVARHPQLRLQFATSDRFAGQSLAQRAGISGPPGALRYARQEEAEALSAGCELVFLATPAEVSAQLAPRLLGLGVKVVDLSGAFRLADPAAYPRWYGFEHGAQGLLPAAYGLTELHRERIREAKLVANPGCYPTAAILPLAPLVREGLVETQTLAISAASGVTGAGRKAGEEYSFSELDGDFRAYKVLRHQHTPEIGQALEGLCGLGVQVAFTPHLLPIRRGILCTTFAWLDRGGTAQKVSAALEEAYAHEPFILLAASAEEVALRNVVGTNRCQIGLSAHNGRVVLVSAIDNLVKGAAGQALQNLNLMLGLEETSGLDGLFGGHP